MSLDGVGRETADSITLYAAGRPVFVVDGLHETHIFEARAFRGVGKRE